MRPGGGREKGFRFERRIATLLGEWWCGDKKALWRNTNSGARATVVGQVYGGDIIPANASIQHWPLCIELKHSESWSFDAFLHGNPKNELLSFMCQCVYASKIGCNHIPLLICVRNRKVPVCLLGESKLIRGIVQARQLPVQAKLKWRNTIPGTIHKKYPISGLPAFYVFSLPVFLAHFSRKDFITCCR